MNRRKHHSLLVALGVAGAAALGLSSVQAQTVIPESYALPVSALDTSAPGFVVRVFQATGAQLPNTIARAEDQIAGFLINPGTGLPFDNIADMAAFNPDGTYDETMTLSYSAGWFPGIPGMEGTTINIALEAITYVELAPGTYRMVVTGDDGAKLTAGNVFDRLQEIVLVESPTTADKIANFTITKAGVYAFRVVYEQGGGGYSLNWYTEDTSATRYLLNEWGGLPCYRALNAGAVVTGPTISAISPLPNAINVSASAGLTAVIRDGSTAFNPATFKLYCNGTDVTAGATIGAKVNGRTKISYAPPVRPDPNDVEEYRLTFADPTSAGGTREAIVSYTVAPYADYVLPDPIWEETFDTVAEGAMPPGWSTVSPITPAGYEDLNDPDSDSYLTWVVVSRERIASITAWNATQRLNTPEAYINGERVESLIQGQCAYHESDIRGGSQYAELFSPNVNLTGKNDIYVVYNSIYTQNQDNIAGVEYSVDNGATWLPVIYMVHKDDIVLKGDGSIDAEGTLTAAHADTADYTDPISGEFVGDTYGAFVKAARATWPNLAEYISGRIDDDQMESKRIEKHRLPLADNKSQVKLRFFQAGTASWFFGVDNVGLYSISGPQAPEIVTQPVGGYISAGASLTLSVVAKGTEPLSYQWKLNDVAIPGATAASHEIASAKAADAGDYTVDISNAGGAVTSLKAKVGVFTGLIGENLVVHLKLDGSLADASGRGNGGTEVGTVAYNAGKVGTQSMQLPSDADYVTLGTPADLNFGTATDFSIAFWTKVIGWTDDPAFIANKDWDSGGNQGYVIATDSDGRLQWNLAGAPGGRKDYDGPADTFSDNAWHHVAVTFQRTGVATTYVDGVLKDTRPISADSNNVDTPSGMATNIGQDGMGDYGPKFSDVSFDDLGIWRRVLTPQEVAGIFEAGQTGKDLSTVVIAGPTDPGSLAIQFTGGKVVLTWDSGATLQSSGAITGGWADEAAQSPATLDPAGVAKFYRLKQP
ncbi:MAG TPA: hypothetical protein PKM73_16180 [Verrucomicrobiota bacterium]|nr:hypothetical protein [Verrucomicrobiota bacterium]HNU52476.1 hypothetical protein [Verrucomicrobiota bacterium]